ncbi:rhodanese-like domain-containing protein [Evansella sp. AB-P1]|uniref:rhodanese-like domain-containing protein n=1 Tax=Evansella sp. AB-P1 TaxID=3037653 RepID=UPI00241CBF20|nr:rhodanese-like domain-containing protein [Evansella sp. AB-P1]MDG5789730.1 rhodanese-like domain-containing protein [Evansella sp. AB-P1]
MIERGGISLFKKYWHIIISAIILLSIVGYQFYLKSGIEQINTAELAEMLNNHDTDNIFFLDVREVNEYNEGHIEGMLNIPLSVLDTEYNEIPKDNTVVIICRSGNRSLQAANILKDLGYSKLINVTGGMLNWNGNVIK